MKIQCEMKTLFIIIVTVFLFDGCAKRSSVKYFGQTPPGNKPELFAPGIVSLDDRNESGITFSPDGKECYFTTHHDSWDWCRIYKSAYTDTAWSALVEASFSNGYAMCPSFSADGKYLFIASDRGEGTAIYRCSRTANGDWLEPEYMDNEMNSLRFEFSCHPSNSGNMFVCSWRAGGVGGCDGWRIPYVNGQYQKAENLGFLNSVVGDCVWAPGPDEKYLIFQSRRPAVGNKGGFFETDLFITFAMPNGEWSNPQNLGPKINSPQTDGFAWITHDGKYLFFSSDRRGTFDIYWVSLDSILENTSKVPLVAMNHKPGDYEFYQLYKDLIDTKTTIYFDLIESGKTKLTIYNRGGEELATILDEVRPKGKNQFVWEGKGFKSGEYLCKLQVSNVDSKEKFMESTIQVLLK